ncbi:MAG: nucleotide exchange factor GrpE [Bacteroidales bacterium]|nr:nucleotide exchange factor GrpE [Bacteroidales bacterium]
MTKKNIKNLDLNSNEDLKNKNKQDLNIEKKETKNETKPEENIKNDMGKSTKKGGKKSKFKELEEKYETLNDKYMRLSAEYDNYRKRTLKERMELMKNAGEDILINFLPVIDNIERAKSSVDDAKDINAVKEGITLIHKNLADFLKERGITEIKSTGEVFDTDMHEAITKIPAPKKNLKGKVVDVIEKGYKMKDKVLRYAKVVVGE